MTTEKQLAFGEKLFKQLQDVAPKLKAEDAPAIVAMIPKNMADFLAGECSVGEAKTVIDSLLKANAQAKTLSGIIEYRWVKVNGNWYVSGPNLKAGETFTVTSSKGEQDVIIGELTTDRDKVYGIPKKAETVDVEPGIYINKNGDFIDAYKTKKGFLVAGLIDKATGKRTYLGKPGLANLDRKMTFEEAKEFGRETGVCCCCSKTLTDPNSISAGIGPVCASKNFGV